MVVLFLHIHFWFIVDSRKRWILWWCARYASFSLRFWSPKLIIIFLKNIIQVLDWLTCKILAILIWLIWFNLKWFRAKIWLIQVFFSEICNIIRRIHHYWWKICNRSLFDHLNVHLRAIDTLSIWLSYITSYALFHTYVNIGFLFFFKLLFMLI